MTYRNTENIVARIEELSGKQLSLNEKREKQILSRQLLALMPQGHGSGLNADLLDDLHAEEIIEETLKRLQSEIDKRILRASGSGGAGFTCSMLDACTINAATLDGSTKSEVQDHTPKVHGAVKHDHTTWYAVITPLGAVLPESNSPAQTKITGTNFTYYVLDFDAATAESIYAQFKLPPNYTPGTSIEIIIQWISTVTTGAVKWGAQILGRADAETFDVALSTEQTATTTTNGTAGKINTSTITISSPDLAAEDIFIVKIRRVATDPADTMTVDARMIMAGVEV